MRCLNGKLKNDVSIGELSDLLACLDRTQDNLKQVISNRKRGYTDNVKENRLIKDLQELKINSEMVYGGNLPKMKITVLD